LILYSFDPDPDTFSTSAPAITNAIFQRVRELRVTLDKLLRSKRRTSNRRGGLVQFVRPKCRPPLRIIAPFLRGVALHTSIVK
jgi:hypothetical protein